MTRGLLSIAVLGLLGIFFAQQDTCSSVFDTNGAFETAEGRTWAKTYGGEATERAYSIEQTDDDADGSSYGGVDYSHGSLLLMLANNAHGLAVHQPLVAADYGQVAGLEFARHRHVALVRQPGLDGATDGLAVECEVDDLAHRSGDQGVLVDQDRLLGLLDLEGYVVTIDAIGCQTEIAETIIGQGADYVLAVKDNQLTLREDVQAAFEHQGRFNRPDYHKTVNKGHGRIEIRECWAISDPDSLTHINHYKLWKGLRSLVKLTSLPSSSRSPHAA